MTKVIGISGWSGSGKTQLIEKLIKFFINEYKLKVCALKHAHKSFAIDHKGKDSYKFFKAGADKVIISSSKKWVMLNKVKEKEPTLEELLINVEKNIDIVLGISSKEQYTSNTSNNNILSEEEMNFIDKIYDEIKNEQKYYY